MKFIDKSVALATTMFSTAYAQRNGYQCYHFSFLFERNRLLAIGQNQSHTPNAKAIKFSNRFQCPEVYRRQFLHSEIDAISRIFSRFYIDSSIKLVNIRLNKYGELRDSKPCGNCQPVLDGLNITKIWYSTNEGKMVCLNSPESNYKVV